ncbi:MAG: putative ABC transporter permease [Acidimicrobiia bacterium]
MWLVSVRDLQFRARRFVIAVVVTSLVFGIALAMDGMRRAVQGESPAVVAMFGADQWLVARGASGPFTSTQVIDADLAEEVGEASGVGRADPVVLSRSVIKLDSDKDVNLVGHVLDGGLGSPSVADGRAARRSGEAVVTKGASVDVGDRIRVGGTPFRVVGTTDEGRFSFGLPSVFVPIEDAQAMVFNGQPLAIGIAVQGEARALDGTTALTNAQVEDDLNRPLDSGIEAIVVTTLLMWVVAAGIIGLIVYLSAIERTRDFAVFKATGAPNRIIIGGLMLQAVMVALVAALLAMVISRFVGQAMPVKSSLSGSAVVQLALIAIVVGVLASLAAVRRALSTDPAAAFGGA